MAINETLSLNFVYEVKYIALAKITGNEASII